MKISQVQNACFRVETKYGTVRIIDTDWRLSDYIKDFGDVEVVYNEARKVYEVPAFAERIAQGQAIAAAACAFWGNE